MNPRERPWRILAAVSLLAAAGAACSEGPPAEEVQRAHSPDTASTQNCLEGFEDHTVRPGDTLWGMCKKNGHNPNDCVPRIVDLQGNSVRHQARSLPIGQNLCVPKPLQVAGEGYLREEAVVFQPEAAATESNQGLDSSEIPVTEEAQVVFSSPETPTPQPEEAKPPTSTQEVDRSLPKGISLGLFAGSATVILGALAALEKRGSRLSNNKPEPRFGITRLVNIPSKLLSKEMGRNGRSLREKTAFTQNIGWVTVEKAADMAGKYVMDPSAKGPFGRRKRTPFKPTRKEERLFRAAQATMHVPPEESPYVWRSNLGPPVGE